MANLLKAEFYKLLHSRYFWGIGAFNFLLSSVLLLDSIHETANLFFASLYNTPLLYFLTIVFSALFVGNDFENRTLQSYINAGHGRGKVLFVKLLMYQTACVVILGLPLLIHGLAGTFFLKENFESVSGNLSTMIMAAVSLPAMCLPPFFFAFIFRDTGKTLAVPMVLFFLAIFLLNEDSSYFVSKILPMGQLRLIALQQPGLSAIRVVFLDFLWILLFYIGSYAGFWHTDLK